MFNTSIPTAQDMTAEWFTGVLHNSGGLAADASVTDVTLSPVGTAESMMSALYKVSLAFSSPGAGPEKLIVKLASPGEGMRMIADMFRFYAREILFYNDFIHKIDTSMPASHLAEIHPDEPFFVLVLDDISGGRSVDQIDGLTLAETELAIDAAADFHAGWWGADLSEAGATFMPYDSEPVHMLMPPNFAKDWAKNRDTIVAAGLPDEVIALCDRFEEVAPNILRAMSGPDTLCHGDFRAENMFFHDDRVDLFDFQLASIGNGATDIGYLIGQSVKDEVAAEHADALLDRYLARLATHGIEMDKDRAQLAYEAGILFFMSISVSMVNNPEMPERSTELALTMLRRTSAELMRTGAVSHFG